MQAEVGFKIDSKLIFKRLNQDDLKSALIKKRVCEENFDVVYDFWQRCVCQFFSSCYIFPLFMCQFLLLLRLT